MRLLTAITPHGYGHAAQALVVLNALMERAPDTELHLATTLPKGFIESRLCCPFSYHSRASDFGLKMGSALDIDLAASARAYASQAKLWDSLVEAEMAFLTAVKPDVLLADIPYLPLAAAHKLNIPALALCSLNWAGIYRHYFSDRAEAEAVLGRLVEAYNSARVFITPEPFMPMPDLSNTQAIGPLARQGVNRRDDINACLGLDAKDTLVLVALGGVQGRLPMERWPRAPGVHWLVQQDWGIDRADCHGIETLELPFIDVLASSDALLGKLGYGTVAECAMNRIPLLYIPRAGWPEEPHLLDWLESNGAARQVERDQAEAGAIIEPLESLSRQPLSHSTLSAGQDAAVDILLSVI